MSKGLMASLEIIDVLGYLCCQKDLHPELLQPDIQHFIHNFGAGDEKSLILKGKNVFGLDPALVAGQIAARKKAYHKLPTYYNTLNIIYPPLINIEQCSSEITARFKTSFVPSGETLLDLTGGFGVDSLWLSPSFKKAVFVEPDHNLISIAQHNHHILGQHHIEYINKTAEAFLDTCEEYFDCIYIDPSRRSEGNQKIFRLSDCKPNVPSLLNTLLQKGKNILLKTSPLIDLKQGIRELGHVEKIYVVSVHNECKEVLFVISPDFTGEPLIHCANIGSNNLWEVLSFYFSEEQHAPVGYSIPQDFIYEPNASLLKAGAFKTIAHRYSLKKIHPNTHFYTASQYIKDFPGKVFQVLHEVGPGKNYEKHFPDHKANIVFRNFPSTVQEFREKSGLQEGGEKFLLGFTSHQKKHLLIAEKVVSPL